MELLNVADAGHAGVARAAAVLREGGVILYPTDTLYGLGADALCDEAVAKIYAIKGREEGKPMHCVVADLAMAEKYAEVNDRARMLAAQFLPGPLTLILKKSPQGRSALGRKKYGMDTGILRGMGTIGIRIPGNAFCIALAREFGGPITATSANRSGEKSEPSVERILAQIGDAAETIDLVIDAGELPASKPSTVVDVSTDEPHILREGAICAADIEEVLKIR